MKALARPYSTYAHRQLNAIARNRVAGAHGRHAARLCPRCFRTDSQVCCWLLSRVIICAVLAALTSVSAPSLPTRKLERFAAGAQIITGELSTKWSYRAHEDR